MSLKRGLLYVFQTFDGIVMNRFGHFSSGENELSFACGIPSQNRREVGILFVHADDGNRLGPHRMFVEMAQTFNTMGYPTFRFDLSGCGDSSGGNSNGDIAKDIFDTINAIRFFQVTEKLRCVILFGISRGARVAINVLEVDKLPLGGMILLSTPFSSKRAAWNNFGAYLREYLRKLKDPGYLLKLIKGKVHFVHIWRTLANAWNIKSRYADVEVNQSASRCPILLIYGECDPIGKEALEYYTDKCRESNLPVESHTIRQANHSFFHYKWKEEIRMISLEWLKSATDKEQ